jgi:hypothetical protein
MQQWWFIDIQYYQYFLNMLRVPLHPSSGELQQNTTPLAATRSTICPPDDGCKGTPKHVEKILIILNINKPPLLHLVRILLHLLTTPAFL